MDVFLPDQSYRWVYDVAHGRDHHDEQPFPWRYDKIPEGVFFESSDVSEIRELDGGDGVKDGGEMENIGGYQVFGGRRLGRSQDDLSMTYPKGPKGGRVKLGAARTSKTGDSLVSKVSAGKVGREVKGDDSGL